tara:strand:+ start:7695 stop:8846 length:1152 start_codon:yes stop_codon:yes gene_type:complete
MKKIIYIINDLKIGGSTKALFRIISNSKFNSRHIVISLNRNDSNHNLLKLQENFDFYFIDWSSFNKLLFSIFNLTKILKKEKNSILHCWLYKSCLIGWILSLIFGNKHVIWNIRHADLSLNFKQIKKYFLIKVLKVISNTNLKRINIIYNSNFSQKVHLNFGFPKRKGIVITNGFDTDKYIFNKNMKDKFLNKFNIKNDVFLISMYARFHPIKNHKILFEAIEHILVRHPDIHIFLAGRFINEKNKKLKNYINNYNLKNKITFGGLLNEEELLSSYSATELTILTSLSESFPNVIGESMACSTPCISSDVGDCKAIIGNSGWITKTNNINDLILKIEKAIKLYEDKTQWRKLQDNCRKRILDYHSIKIEVENYKNLENLLSIN